MSLNTIAKKEVSKKLVSYSFLTFQELSGSQPSDKISKIIKRNSRKLAKAIHAQIKKANKKRAKQLKGMMKEQKAAGTSSTAVAA